MPTLPVAVVCEASPRDIKFFPTENCACLKRIQQHERPLLLKVFPDVLSLETFRTDVFTSFENAFKYICLFYFFFYTVKTQFDTLTRGLK